MMEKLRNGTLVSLENSGSYVVIVHLIVDNFNFTKLSETDHSGSLTFATYLQIDFVFQSVPRELSMLGSPGCLVVQVSEPQIRLI